MAVYEVEFDDKRCKGCAICVKVCPKSCLQISENYNQSGHYFPEVINSGDCTGCGACVKLCPDFAVTVYEILEEAG